MSAKTTGIRLIPPPISSRLQRRHQLIELTRLLTEVGIAAANIDPIVTLMLWYGVLGVRRIDGSVTYIYSVNYDMAILNGIIRKLQSQGLVYVVNPAFIPGLQIREDLN